MSKRGVAVIAVSLLFAGTAADAEVYKWTDDEGVTHYTQQPPPGSDEAKVLDPQVGSPSDAASASAEQAADQGGTQTQGEQGEDTQSIEQFCKELRENIETLKSDQPVKVRTGEDSLKTLDSEERQARLKRAQSKLESQCS